MNERKPPARSCTDCVHYIPGSPGGCYPDWVSEAPECLQHPAKSSHVRFPFRDTKCKDWRCV
jgi:hypothetical protein